jgi:hypothetical protein
MAHHRANLHSDITSHLLYAQSHDTVDNVVVVLLEGLDGLLPADAGLGHDELDVLGLKTGVIDLLTVILLLLLGLGTLDSLALGTLGGVVVAGVVVGRLVGELLSSLSLSLGVEVLNLGLTEDAVHRVSIMPPPGHWYSSSNVHPGVAVGALVDVGLRDDEKDVLGAAEGDAGDALDVLQAELSDGLAGLLLVPVVNGDGSASRLTFFFSGSSTISSTRGFDIFAVLELAIDCQEVDVS